MTGYTTPPTTANNDDSDTSPNLGIIAKSASAILPSNEGKSDLSDTPDSVVIRYALQSQARKLLPAHRVSDCARKIVPNVKHVKVVREREGKNRVSYRNLIKCGLLWACPVCAAKITERRALELQAGVARWHAEDGFVIFATYTMQHASNATLADSLSILQSSLRRFKSGRAYQDMTAEYGIVGTVRALEITYGDSGWHPHVHELIFVRPLSDRAVKRFIASSRDRWIKSLRAEGGNGIPDVAYTAKTAQTDIYDYVVKFGKHPAGAKWSIEREIVKSPSKLARRNGVTPFQMLELSMTEPRFEALFVEYVNTMHGVRQLVWSKGLKELLGLADVEDNQIADDAADSAYDVLATIEAADWYYMLNMSRGKFADVRAELLRIARTGTSEDIRAFVESFYRAELNATREQNYTE